jgi:hypothetical protein
MFVSVRTAIPGARVGCLNTVTDFSYLLKNASGQVIPQAPLTAADGQYDIINIHQCVSSLWYYSIFLSRFFPNLPAGAYSLAISVHLKGAQPAVLPSFPLVISDSSGATDFISTVMHGYDPGHFDPPQIVRADAGPSGLLDGKVVNALTAAVQAANVDMDGAASDIPRGESARIWSDRGRYTVSLDSVSGTRSRVYVVSNDGRTTAVAAAPATAPSIAIEPIVLSALIVATAQFERTVQLDDAAKMDRQNGAFSVSYVKRAMYVLVGVSYADASLDPRIDKTLPNGCGRFTRAYEVDVNTLSVIEKPASCD